VDRCTCRRGIRDTLATTSTGLNNPAQEKGTQENHERAAVKHLANLASHERLARAQRTVQQNTLAVLHPELFYHLHTKRKQNLLIKRAACRISITLPYLG
jgi:hypothetical protein